MTNNTEPRCTGINRMGMSGSAINRFTDIYNTIRWTKNKVCRFTNTFNVTTTGIDGITT